MALPTFNSRRFSRPAGRSSAILLAILFVAAVVFTPVPTAFAAEPNPQPSFPGLSDMLRSVVKVHAYALPEAESARRLGMERSGNGIVVGDGGLVVTVGYLVTETESVEIIDENHRTNSAIVVGYDAESGLALLKVPGLSKLKPIPLGNSRNLKADTPVAVSGAGGIDNTIPAVVVSRRPFAGSWEYLLDDAIYTAPAHADWSGAALISTDGKLLGIGALYVNRARSDSERLHGNVFVPVDLLQPLIAQVAANGKVTPKPHPWLGLNPTPHPGGLIVGRLSQHSPAAAAGLKRGDMVVALADKPVDDLADFYRRVWAMGAPGIDVPLTIVREGRSFDVQVRSANRYQFLAKEPTY